MTWKFKKKKTQKSPYRHTLLKRSQKTISNLLSACLGSHRPNDCHSIYWQLETNTYSEENKKSVIKKLKIPRNFN